MILTQANINDAFGKISPPPGTSSTIASNPEAGLAQYIGLGIQLFIFVSLMFLLLYMLWGGFDWITSGGEKEKIVKAQNKITNALIGIVLVIGALTAFSVVTGNILHLNIIQAGPGGWTINIPKFPGP